MITTRVAPLLARYQPGRPLTSLEACAGLPATSLTGSVDQNAPARPAAPASVDTMRHVVWQSEQRHRWCRAPSPAPGTTSTAGSEPLFSPASGSSCSALQTPRPKADGSGEAQSPSTRSARSVCPVFGGVTAETICRLGWEQRLTGVDRCVGSCPCSGSVRRPGCSGQR